MLFLFFSAYYYIINEITTSLVLIKSLRISFIITWNIASELVRLKNITVGLNNPSGIVKATFHLSPSLILTLLYPHLKYNFMNTFFVPNSPLYLKSVATDNCSSPFTHSNTSNPAPSSSSYSSFPQRILVPFVVTLMVLYIPSLFAPE